MIKVWGICLWCTLAKLVLAWSEICWLWMSALYLWHLVWELDKVGQKIPCVWISDKRFYGCTIIVLYSKGGSKNGKHAAVPNVSNVVAISYVGIQVFQWIITKYCIQWCLLLSLLVLSTTSFFHQNHCLASFPHHHKWRTTTLKYMQMTSGSYPSTILGLGGPIQYGCTMWYLKLVYYFSNFKYHIVHPYHMGPPNPIW